MRWSLPFLVSTAGFAVACSATGDETAARANDVVTIATTDVRKQLVDNCWLYAQAGWVESLHLAVAPDEKINVSEGYWTFFDWVEKVAGGDLALTSNAQPLAEDTQLIANGNWGRANELLLRYGWVNETDFTAFLGSDGTAAAQKQALAALTTSLATGALATPGARADRATVFHETAKAWGFSPAFVSALEGTFGADLSRNLVRGATPTPSSKIHRAKEIRARGPVDGTLATVEDLVGTQEPSTTIRDGRRVGTLAWSQVPYTWDASSTARRDAILHAIQATLNDRLAVPVAWWIGTDQAGVFDGVQARFPGSHQSIFTDYQAENVPGFGTLALGVPVTDASALAAAFGPAASLTRFRIKNSWGVEAETSHDYLPAQPGFNDLTRTYLDAPVPNAAAVYHVMRSVVLPNARIANGF